MQAVIFQRDTMSRDKMNFIQVVICHWRTMSRNNSDRPFLKKLSLLISHSIPSYASMISSVDLKPLRDRQIQLNKLEEMDYRQELWKFAVDASRLIFGANLVPGPPIIGDGDCILSATHSQVLFFGLIYTIQPKY